MENTGKGHNCRMANQKETPSAKHAFGPGWPRSLVPEYEKGKADAAWDLEVGKSPEDCHKD